MLIALLAVAIAAMASTPVESADCTDTTTWPCCAATGMSPNSYNCQGGGQASSANVTLTGSLVVVGTRKDLKCDLAFDYTITGCSSPRTLRFCWYACMGNDNPCGTTSCSRICEEADYASGTGYARSVTFINPFASFDVCGMCRLAVIDVEGNESCYPISNCATIDACSQGCGPGVMQGSSACVDL